MAFDLSHIAYHIAPEDVRLLQGTLCCSRLLHCSIECYTTAGDTISTAGDTTSTAGDTTYILQRIPHYYMYMVMAFDLSHIAYPIAPEHVMLLQRTPCCSSVLHCSIECYTTAGDTTSTAEDTTSTAGDTTHIYSSGYHTTFQI